MTAPEWQGRTNALSDSGMAVIGGLLAMAAFGSAYGGQFYLLAGAIGLCGGAAVGLVGNRLRQPVLLVITEAVVVFFILGLPLAGGAPTPAALHTLAVTAVTGWASLLSTAPVVGGTQHLLVIPLLCGLASGVVTNLMAGRLRHTSLAVIPTLGLLAVGILFGTATSPTWLARDAVLASVLIAWAAWRGRATAIEGFNVAGTRRAVMAALILSASGVLGYLTAGSAEGANSHLRYVLRDHIPPPFNVDNYPSPLSGFRNYVLPTAEGNMPLFKISGAPTGSRLRIATMDAYNGIVFQVASGAPGSSASGNFATVGSPVSSIPCPSEARCQLATVTVQLLHYSGVWLPDLGTVRSVTFRGSEAQSLNNAFRYNVDTDAAVVSTGVQGPLSYTFVTDTPKLPAPSAMASAAAALVALPTPTNVSKVIATKAATLTAGVSGAFGKAARLSQQLSREGAYSDGTIGSAPSLPGHGEFRLEQFLNLPQPVGDAEQYAAAMDLMARSLGLPARVVLGVKLRPGTHTYTGRDMTAWVEVDYVGVGWYPFDPTSATNAQAHAAPPPPPPSSSNQAQYQPPAVPPAAGLNAGATATKVTPRPPPQRSALVGDLLQVVKVLLLIALVAALILVPPLGVVMAKSKRRARRRSAPTTIAQMEGGWTEVVDHARDLRRKLPRRATRKETAEALGGSSLPVAMSADWATFGPDAPSEAEAGEFWARVDYLLSEMEADLSSWGRLLARINPRTLISDDVTAKAANSAIAFAQAVRR